jgi:hypothetical protein
MNISGNIRDNHGHWQYVNLWAPDPDIKGQVSRAIESDRLMRQAHRRNQLAGLAKAGVFGIIALALIAAICGILAILPKPLKIAVVLLFVGWMVWTTITCKPQAQPVDNAPRATLVATPTPAPEVVRPALPVDRVALDNYWKEQEKKFRPTQTPSAARGAG